VTVVRATRVTKYYGRARGILDLDLEVLEGEVFGFLGPNGAGKTTTLRLLLDFIRPSSGRVELFGLDARRDSVAIRRRVGYLPGELQLYDRLTPRELLAYFMRLRGRRDFGDGAALATRLELELDRQIRALSKGNRQKVGLVQAFMHRPELLVLDEPTSGLDPLVQQVFYELVREVAADGRTVLLSSHVMPEVQHVAERVAVIRDGRLVLVDSVESLRARAFKRIEVTFAEPPPPDAFADVRGAHEQDRHGDTVLFAVEDDADELVKAIARRHVVAIDSREADLEDIFLGLYREESGGAA
jgi:ABC-2 type transport system ATP-binding protein